MKKCETLIRTKILCQSHPFLLFFVISISDFLIIMAFRELESKNIAMSRMDLDTPKDVVAPDDMTAADYYFDSYAHFGVYRLQCDYL